MKYPANANRKLATTCLRSRASTHCSTIRPMGIPSSAGIRNGLRRGQEIERRTTQTPCNPLSTDMTRDSATACIGGMICNHHPSANSDVPKPASPLMKPPAVAPASR